MQVNGVGHRETASLALHLTLTFYGSEKVFEHYNVMRPVKAAMESVARYMAVELGPKGIRAHAISPGPLKTRAASGTDHFDELLDQSAARAPVHYLVSIRDVGDGADFLSGDSARSMTGSTIYVDAGYHIVG